MAVAKQMPCAGHDDRGVHADHLAAGVDQRPARVAGIERRVGLDHVVDQPSGLRAQRAAQRADHACRDGAFEAVGIADGDRELPHAQPARAAELRGGQRPPDTRITARSVCGSSPMRSASSSGRRAARPASLDAPPATWLLVRIRPSGVKMNPEPLPAALVPLPRSLAAHVDLHDGGLTGRPPRPRPRVGVEQAFVVHRRRFRRAARTASRRGLRPGEIARAVGHWVSRFRRGKRAPAELRPRFATLQEALQHRSPQRGYVQRQNPRLRRRRSHDSWNKKLIRLGAESVRRAGAEVTLIDLRDVAMPLYDGDLEAHEGLPANARELKRLMIEHDGFLISSPEYNSSISGVLKNAIDWVSRPQPNEPPAPAFRGKVAGLLAASPGNLGGIRGLAVLRQILNAGHDRDSDPVRPRRAPARRSTRTAASRTPRHQAAVE